VSPPLAHTEINGSRCVRLTPCRCGHVLNSHVQVIGLQVIALFFLFKPGAHAMPARHLAHVRVAAPGQAAFSDIDDDDDCEAKQLQPSVSVCMLGQVSSGALFSFLFGGLGIAIAGDSRSATWAGGVLIGAVLGVAAAQGLTSEGGGCSPADALQHTAGVPREALSAFFSCIGAPVVLWLCCALLPRFPWDHVAVCVLTSTGAWGASAHGHQLFDMLLHWRHAILLASSAKRDVHHAVKSTASSVASFGATAPPGGLLTNGSPNPSRIFGDGIQTV